MTGFLDIKEHKFSGKTAFILILIAYAFALGVRYYYFSWAVGIDEFIWNGHLMINNVDGYYYAAGAKELLNGTHVVGDLNPYHSLPSMLTAAVVKLFPFLTLDEVILWMPAVLGSLIVVPVFLIGRSLKNDILGFSAALVASIALSYYNRTMVGYYDTDMLVIVLLMFIVWGVVEFLANENSKMMLFVPLVIILYEWWYPQSRTVLLALVGMTFVYISLFKRKSENYVFVLFMAFALMGYKFYVNAAAVSLLYVFYRFKPNLFSDRNILIGLYIAVIGLLFLSGTLHLLIVKFSLYFNRADTGSNPGALHFYNVSKTIREATQIKFNIVADRISGNMGLFVLSAIGYALMIIRYPVMSISLPMAVIGVMAHKLGLRFTIYAVPFFALGLVYLALLLGEYLTKLFIEGNKYIPFARYSVLVIALGFSFYFNILHVILYKTPSTFLKQEVASLDELSKIAKPQDYVVTWWDYGYPIRYYAGMKTLIDGGKHRGSVNFPVSYALTHDQVSAANIARLDVEYTDKLETARELGKKFKTKGFIKDMMKKYGYNDPDEFLASLHNPDFKLPEKTRDIYLYLPFRLADIYPTVAVFSNINLKTGKVKKAFIVATRVVSGSKQALKFANGLWIDMKGYLHWGEKLIPVNSFYVSTFDKTGRFKVLKQPMHENSNIYVLWYKPLNKILILSKEYMNSTYVQMFFLGKYDTKLYEPVIVNPFVRVYKLKK